VVGWGEGEMVSEGALMLGVFCVGELGFGMLGCVLGGVFGSFSAIFFSCWFCF
jgi:hypothetical protein